MTRCCGTDCFPTSELLSLAGFCVDPETKACTVPKVWSNADRSFSCPGEQACKGHLCWHWPAYRVVQLSIHHSLPALRTAGLYSFNSLFCFREQQTMPNATKKTWRLPWRSRSRPTLPLPTAVSCSAQQYGRKLAPAGGDNIWLWGCRHLAIQQQAPCTDAQPYLLK